MSDLWMYEGAMLASCYVVGAGLAALGAYQQQRHPVAPQQQSPSHPQRRKNRRKPRCCHATSTDEATSTSGGSLGLGNEFEEDHMDEGDPSTTSNSTASSTRSMDQPFVLPLCSADRSCLELNDPSHYTQFRHTCRLNPCLYSHVPSHCFYFSHSSNPNAASPRENKDQESSPPPDLLSEVGSSSADYSPASHSPSIPVSQQHISSHVPNASAILIYHQETGYSICGDWSKVRLHGFKRYLHQVTGIDPKDQRIWMKLNEDTDSMNSVEELTDDFAFLADLGVRSNVKLIVEGK